MYNDISFIITIMIYIYIYTYIERERLGKTKTHMERTPMHKTFLKLWEPL